MGDGGLGFSSASLFNEMVRTENNFQLHLLAVLTAFATLVLLCVGGLVTSHGAGMSVPDWPNTYGYNMFLFPISKWVGGILYEHTHRLVAAFVGLLTAVLAVWLWARETQGRNHRLGIAAIVLVLALMGVRKLPVYVALAALSLVVCVIGLWQFKKNPRALRWLGVTALAAVILQGVLGGLRVVWLKDQIGIFHATLAQLFFVLTCMLALFTSRWWRDTSEVAQASRLLEPSQQNAAGTAALHWIGLAITLLIFIQLVLGATMRHQHAGLAIPDFPLAYGKLWPATDAASIARYNQQRVEVVAANPITAFQIILQMAHRLAALLIVVGVGIVAKRAKRELNAGNPLRPLAWVWLGLILVQIGLGAATIWSDKAADIATAHVLVGALSLATGALWCAMAFRYPRGLTEPGRAPASFDVLRENPFQMNATASFRN